MLQQNLWKYCTPEHCREFIRSLRLMDGMDMDEKERLRCLYSLSNHAESHYRSIAVPKKSGGKRMLREPDFLLKTVQRNILHHILEDMPVSEYACAYRKGRGIRENAAVHLGQPLILKLDIQDFFGSITFPMVMKSAFPGNCYPPAVRVLLTNLCCFKDRLPQGAPTSAAISNLVMEPFDRSMGAWCAERNIFYSRYCDDMTFSGEFDAGTVIGKVRSYLEAMGFSLNDKKTRAVTAGKRQTVTGITVNEKLQAPRDYRRKLRQEVYFSETYGVREHLKRVFGKEPEQEAVYHYLESLLGRINFTLSVNPEDENFKKMRQTVRGFVEKLSGN